MSFSEVATENCSGKYNCSEIRSQNPRKILSQPAFTSSKLTIETREQGVKYVQS